jgi:hypothetical protein
MRETSKSKRVRGSEARRGAVGDDGGTQVDAGGTGLDASVTEVESGVTAVEACGERIH